MIGGIVAGRFGEQSFEMLVVDCGRLGVIESALAGRGDFDAPIELVGASQLGLKPIVVYGKHKGPAVGV